MSAADDRKQLGAFYTPEPLVAAIVDAVVTAEFVSNRRGRTIRVVDPACGDGRFLRAVATCVHGLGGVVEAHGVDIDPAAVEAARSASWPAGVDRPTIHLADALDHEWGARRYDLVIGNPPFLSQMAERTTRGGASHRGGGPYADAAVEFLALGADLADPDGGRLAFVLPQSLLSSRDAAAIRDRIDAQAEMIWSSWSAERLFDAQVNTCALAFEFASERVVAERRPWSTVVTERLGIPTLSSPPAAHGTLADRATLNANFRDEYYGLVPAVGDHRAGPPLITSGLIDPGCSRWGEQPVTFARERYTAPRVDLERLDPKMSEWARRRLVPKVLVANQTQIIEAVCDPDGSWLPGVPVISVYPSGAHWDDAAALDREVATESAWRIAAVLTSGVATAWLWHRTAGTGLSAASVRVSPVVLGDLPWPAGNVDRAVEALRRGDLRGCARVVEDAYGLSGTTDWWSGSLERIEARHATKRARQADPG